MKVMKILVFSDSHGVYEPMISVIQNHSPDAVVFLGDMDADIRCVMRRCSNVSFNIVRGNNDRFCSEPERLVVSLGERKIFATHGHLYRDTLLLVLAAKERGANTALFGHTHRPLLQKENGILLMNPGSVRDTGTYGVFVEGEEPKIKKF